MKKIQGLATLIVGLSLLLSCRTTREKVEVLGTEARPKTTSATSSTDSSVIPASMRTTLIISALTMPAGIRGDDSKLTVIAYPIDNGAETEGQSFEAYKLGTPIPLIGLKEYRINVIVLGYGDLIIAENRHCSNQIKIKVQFGQNKITAPVCLGPSTRTSQ